MDPYTTPSTGPSRPNTRLTLPPMMIFPTDYHHSLNDYHRLPSLQDHENDRNYGPTSADSYDHHHPFHTRTPPSDFDHESGSVIRSELPYHDPILPPGPGPQPYGHRYPTDTPSYPAPPTLSIDLLLAAAHAATEHPHSRSHPNYIYAAPATPRAVWHPALNHTGISERPLSPPHTPRTALSATYDSGPSSGPYAVCRATESDEFQHAYHSPPPEVLCSASSPALLPPAEIDSGKVSQVTRKRRAPAKRPQTWSSEKPKQGKKKRSAGYVRPIIRHRKRVGQRLLDMLKNAPVPSRTPQMEVHRARCFPFAEMENKLSEWYGLRIEWPGKACFEMGDLRSTRRMRQDELDRLNETLDTGLVRIRLADHVLEEEPNRANEFSYPSDGSAADDPDLDAECDSESSPRPVKKTRRSKARSADVDELESRSEML